MTYAGRLDPLATGLLIILTGDDVHKKESFTNLAKTYEIEICFGLKTDTGDLLGVIEQSNFEQYIDSKQIVREIEQTKQWSYPKFSARTVDGKQLHQLARLGNISEPPVRLMSYEFENHNLGSIDSNQIYHLHKKSLMVKGDFRQKEIQESWAAILLPKNIPCMEATINVTSGTYIRSIPDILKEKIGITCVITKIHRTKIGEFTLEDCIELP
jgi:tRNA pseudouridine55 synthase